MNFVNFLAFLLSLYFINLTSAKKKSSSLSGLVIPPDEEREFKAIRLSNGIKAILVSDPNVTKAAVALSVPVGHYHNTKVEGLAHFMEHMLTLDPIYSKENGLDKFLSENGGASNAETSVDLTVYYYDVKAKYLNASMPRFVNRFISPSFSRKSIEREVAAVNSEYRIDLNDEKSRIMNVIEQTAKEGHPFTNFDNGNYETLISSPKAKGIDIKKSLYDFFERYYSSNLFNLAVYSPQPLTELRKLVEEHFVKIQNRNKAKPKLLKESPYQKDQLGEIINIKVKSDAQNLTLLFPIQYCSKKYTAAEIGYISNLLNLDTNGSLQYFLTSKNLSTLVTASELSSGSMGHYPFLEIEIVLTTSGMKQVNDIVANFFQIIQMFKKASTKRHKRMWDGFFKESANKSILTPEMTSKEVVQELAERLPAVSLRKVLFEDEAMDQYNFKMERIVNLLNDLRPDNLRVFVTSKDCCPNEAKLVEKYYRGEYTRAKIDKSIILEWKNVKSNKSFYLPPKDVKRLANKTPQRLFNKSFIEIWQVYKNEEKIAIHGNIISPLVASNATNANLNNLWVDLLNNEYDNAFKSTKSGIKFELNDYNLDSTDLEEMLLNLANFSPITPEEFESAKELRVKQLRNELLGQSPCDQADDIADVLLKHKPWATQTLLNSMNDIQQSDLEDYSRKFIMKIKMQLVFTSCFETLSQEKAIEIAEMLQSLFNASKMLEASELQALDGVQLQQGLHYRRTIRNPSFYSSCTQLYIQIGKTNDTTNEGVLAQILARIGEYYAYAILRSREQLGYSISFDYFKVRGAYSEGHAMLISVGGATDPNFVESRIYAFLIEFRKILELMSKSTFSRYKSVVRYEDSIFEQIFSGRLMFNSNELLENTTFSKQDLLKFYDEKILNPDKRRILSVLVIGELDSAIDPSKYPQINATEILWIPLSSTNLTLENKMLSGSKKSLGRVKNGNNLL